MPHKLTAERLEALKKELAYLKTDRDKEVAELLKEARSFGDLSENSEYDEAKSEQGKLYARIDEIEQILDDYVLVEESATIDSVGLGCTVEVEDLDLGEVLTYIIVTEQDADLKKKQVNENSPFGKAVMGKKVGDIAIVEAPMGNIEYKVVSISR